ncbi:MAG: hypothetical protein P1U34_12450 [Coxiellaceae bacterium]|nr:hypothetical protein [Coxiellaceae bacterium]
MIKRVIISLFISISFLFSSIAIAATLTKTNVELETEIKQELFSEIQPEIVGRVLELCQGQYLCKCIKGNNRAEMVLGDYYPKVLQQCSKAKHDLKYPTQ